MDTKNDLNRNPETSEHFFEIRSTPVLTGEDAERFVREAEENERNPQRRKLLFSFDDIDRMMERSRKYLKEHGGKGPFAK